MGKTKIALKIEKLERLLGRKINLYPLNEYDKSLLLHLYCGDTPEQVIEIERKKK